MPDLSLEHYLETPDLISNLSRPKLCAMLAQCKALEGAILARLLDERDSHASPPDGDRLLTADEAATMLAVPRSWVYQRGKRLGLAVQLGDSTLRYSHAKVQALIRDRACKSIASRK